MHSLFIVLLFFTTITSAEELTFHEFTEGNFFSNIDPSYLELKAKCRKNYDDNNQIKFYEIILFSKGGNVFDFNKVLKSNLVGRENLKKPFYTFTVWNWFNALAIKTPNHEFMTNTSQESMRRNELISEGLFNEIIRLGEFQVYFHYLLDNSKSVGNFKIVNPGDLIDCLT